MKDKFDEFLERLEGPLPEPKTKQLLETAIGIQTACSGLAYCCADFTAHLLSSYSPSLGR
jgi:hypothetical protein